MVYYSIFYSCQLLTGKSGGYFWEFVLGVCFPDPQILTLDLISDQYLPRQM